MMIAQCLLVAGIAAVAVSIPVTQEEYARYIAQQQTEKGQPIRRPVLLQVVPAGGAAYQTGCGITATSLPTASRLPTTARCLPATARRIPTTARRIPTAARRVPVTSDLPATGRVPTTGTTVPAVCPTTSTTPKGPD
ncbi:unnamed protein product [Aphis gossypii]|uniref:Uncharacterized protein n=1 Tax=Aphis gossypii TaxID=80765 RepID=A0A9P0J344_APHGO|nr:unnamed protein product [Aphis gossypii]